MYLVSSPVASIEEYFIADVRVELRKLHAAIGLVHMKSIGAWYCEIVWIWNSCIIIANAGRWAVEIVSPY